MNKDQFELAIVDADSVIYRIAFRQPSIARGKKEFDEGITNIMESTEAQECLVFIKGTDNFRYHVAVDYKSNRANVIDPEVKDRINVLYEYARDFCIESDNAEADDYCGISSKLARLEDKSYILCHIDKDLNMLPGWHYDFYKKSFYEVSLENGYRFLMKQLLMGDATDGIQGIKGLGPKTADKILDGVPVERVFQTVLNTYQNKCGGDWQNTFHKTANLIYIRESQEDLRSLDLNELKERFEWKPTMDTGSPSVIDPQMLSGSSMRSSDQLEDNTLERNS